MNEMMVAQPTGNATDELGIPKNKILFDVLDDDILGNSHEMALAEVDELLCKIMGSLLRKVQCILELLEQAGLLPFELFASLGFVDRKVAILPAHGLPHCLAVLRKSWETGVRLCPLASGLLDHLAVGVDKRDPAGRGIAGLLDSGFVGGLYALAQKNVDLVHLVVQLGTLTCGHFALELVANNGTVLGNGTCDGDGPGRAARLVENHEVVDNLTSAERFNVVGSSHDHNGRVGLALVLSLVEGIAEPSILPDIVQAVDILPVVEDPDHVACCVSAETNVIRVAMEKLRKALGIGSVSLGVVARKSGSERVTIAENPSRDGATARKVRHAPHARNKGLEHAHPKAVLPLLGILGHHFGVGSHSLLFLRRGTDAPGRIGAARGTQRAPIVAADG